MSRQHLSQEEVDRIVLSCKAREMVDHGHPAALQFCLPDVLKDTVEVYKALDAQMHMSESLCVQLNWDTG